MWILCVVLYCFLHKFFVCNFLLRSKPWQHLDWAEWSDSRRWFSVDWQDGPGEDPAVFVLFCSQLIPAYLKLLELHSKFWCGHCSSSRDSQQNVFSTACSKKKVALFAQVCFFNLACLCMCAAIWELAWKPARQLLCWRRRLCGDDCSWEWQMEWRALQLQSALRLQEGNRWEQHRGKKRRGEFSATETVDKDDWEKRWGGREQQDVNWKEEEVAKSEKCQIWSARQQGIGLKKAETEWGCTAHRALLSAL